MTRRAGRTVVYARKAPPICQVLPRAAPCSQKARRGASLIDMAALACEHQPWECHGEKTHQVQESNRTALRHAAHRGHAGVVHVLLRNGADTALLTGGSRRAFVVADRCGNDSVASMIWEREREAARRCLEAQVPAAAKVWREPTRGAMLLCCHRMSKGVGRAHGRESCQRRQCGP